MNLIKQEAVVLSSAKEFLRDARTKLEKRFWSKVSGFGDACWIWQKQLSAQGYGIIVIQGRRMLSHRIAYELVFGFIPEGKFILHRCDTRPCVNPSHLQVGTHLENMKQMKDRNRGGGSGRTRYWRDGIDG